MQEKFAANLMITDLKMKEKIYFVKIFKKSSYEKSIFNMFLLENFSQLTISQK